MGGRVLGETGEVRIKGGFGSRVSSFTYSLSPANPCPPQPPCLVGAPSHVAPTQCFPHTLHPVPSSRTPLEEGLSQSSFSSRGRREGRSQPQLLPEGPLPTFSQDGWGDGWGVGRHTCSVAAGFPSPSRSPLLPGPLREGKEESRERSPRRAACGHPSPGR